MTLKSVIGVLGAGLALAPAGVFAAPACDMPAEVEMADGLSHRVRPRGDDRFNWVEDESGYAVTPGADGRWRYARRVKGRWEAEGMKPLQRGLEGRSADAAALSAPAEASPSASGLLAGSAGGAGMLAAPATTPQPLLVVLVAFSNKALTYTAASWSNAVFGASGKTVNTYYRQASGNRFWFTPPNETQGVAKDGVVSVTLTTAHPNTTDCDAASIRAAVKSALTAADPYINYQAYDTDGDGKLSMAELHLVFVFAGYDASYGNPSAYLVWAHSGSFYTPGDAPVLDGVSVGEYAASNGGGYAVVGEGHYYSGSAHQATIGVICHELGHGLGLIDLYDTDFSSDGVGTHCLMGTGNWGYANGDSYLGQTPVLPSAYCRETLGFTAVQLAAGTGTVCTLKQASDSTCLTNVVRLNTPDGLQHFLVENRQQTGFDAGLYYPFGYVSGGGLAVWHIDESMANNATDARRRVDLEEAASPVLDAYGGSAGKVQNYYYSGNVTRFDAATSPSSALNGGGASLAAVYGVGAAGAQMSFTVDAGQSCLSAAAQSFAFVWQGGATQVVFRNTGNLPLVWRTASETWCAASPTNGTLTAGATQEVAVACATNRVRMVPRSGLLSVTATDPAGAAAAGSPLAVPLAQAARPPDPATIFSVR